MKFFLFTFLLFSISYAQEIGIVESVSGEAYIAHGLSKKKIVKAGDKILQGTRIKTKAKGKVIIKLFKKKNKVIIGSNEYVKLQIELGSNVKNQKSKKTKLKEDCNCKILSLHPSAKAGVRSGPFEIKRITSSCNIHNEIANKNLDKTGGASNAK